MVSVIKKHVIWLVLLVFGLLEYSGQSYFSPVYDELANIPAGYNLLKTERNLDPTHPPLYRYAQAIPLFLLQADPLPADSSLQWKPYGKSFLLKNNISWQTILQNVRLVTIFTATCFLAFLYFYSKKKWGTLAALGAVLFLAFEPTFLAHSQLATLDTAFAFAYFALSVALVHYLEKPDNLRFWLLHLAFGVAFLCKFTTLPFLVVTIFCLVYFRKKSNIPLRKFLWSPFILAFLVFAAYRFQIKKASDDPQIADVLKKTEVQAELQKAEAKYGDKINLILNTPIPAFDFWKGFAMQIFHSAFQDKWENKANFQYLDGEYSRRGWRHYFVCTFVWKSTLATLFLVTFFVAFLIFKTFKSRQNASLRVVFKSFTFIVFTLSPFILFLACSMGTINIGHRYILPIYAFLAFGVAWLIAQGNKTIKITIFVALFFHIASSLSVFPHHLSYFNECSRSRFLLADSNVDWGQDLLFLEKDLNEQRQNYTATWGDCSGVIQANDLNINLLKIPNTPDALGKGRHLLYLSVHRFLNKSDVNPKGLYPWLTNFSPKRKVGSSILVFEWENK